MHRGIRTTESGFVWLHRIIDSFLPIICLIIATKVHSVEWHDRYIILGILGGLIFIMSSQAMGAYNDWRGRTYLSNMKLILNSWALTWVILIIIAFLYKETGDYSRFSIIIWAIITPIILISYRLLLRALLHKHLKLTRNTKKIAIAGAGKVGRHIVSIIQENTLLGCNITAYFDDDPTLHNTTINGVPVIGPLNQASKLANENLFDELYICLPLRADKEIQQLLHELTNTTAIVKFIPDLFCFDLLHAKWSELNGIPIISVFDSPLSNKTARVIKRIEDFSLSAIILFFISPILLGLSIGIKLTSPGPVFYLQTRIGWNGKKFKMYKFRSMPTNTEKGGVQWGNSQSKTNTKFGQFIRKYSLDELPQFINVLLGDMSIVGPRPERDIFVEKFRTQIPRYMQKHMVKAGITGWAQINGWRGDTSLHKRIEYDLDYINRWTIWMDIKIIAVTAVKAFSKGL